MHGEGSDLAWRCQQTPSAGHKRQTLLSTEGKMGRGAEMRISFLLNMWRRLSRGGKRLVAGYLSQETLP